MKKKNRYSVIRIDEEEDLEILFVRHGESEANVLNLFYGASDFKLTDIGKKQAGKAGAIVRKMNFVPDKIYVSSLVRTHETLENMGFCLDEAEQDARLNERNLGEFEGLNHQELVMKNPTLFEDWRKDWLDYRPGGGESFLDFRGRISSFMEELKYLYTGGEKLLVVCHGGTMKTIISYVFGHETDTFMNVEIHNCSLLRVNQNNDVFFFDALYNIEDFS